jgi:hypothetical protein
VQKLNVIIFVSSLQEVITLEDVTGSLLQSEAASKKMQNEFQKRLNLNNDK